MSIVVSVKDPFDVRVVWCKTHFRYDVTIRGCLKIKFHETSFPVTFRSRCYANMLEVTCKLVLWNFRAHFAASNRQQAQSMFVAVQLQADGGRPLSFRLSVHGCSQEFARLAMQSMLCWTLLAFVESKSELLTFSKWCHFVSWIWRIWYQQMCSE